jgi:hypothetical protein
LKLAVLYFLSMLFDQPYDQCHSMETHPFYVEELEIIGQPRYSSKLRYRSDYEANKKRRGVLHSRTNAIYQSPTIHVSQ